MLIIRVECIKKKAKLESKAQLIFMFQFEKNCDNVICAHYNNNKINT
jgi:hypothetical protein